MADAVLGVLGAVLVLAQATLLAQHHRPGVGRGRLASLRGEIAALVAVFAARAALAWGFEVAGRRAASSVLCDLRIALVAPPAARRRPPRSTACRRGGRGRRGTAASRRSRRTSRSYLPQVVLACVVPLAVLAWSAPIDLASAVIMPATLPLVPVFMWLVGRHTSGARGALARARRLSVHFLDVVRGLPTLRAFNRGAAQARRRRGRRRYRRATMETLRVAFLSGAVLELAATLGVAIVAVTVGVRLVGGGLGLEAGLMVLVLAPELYLPLRRLGAEYHASADGMAVAGRILDLLDEPAAAASAGDAARAGPARGDRSPRARVASPTRRAPARCSRGRSRARPGETVALVGAERRGEVHARVAAAAALAPDRRAGSRSAAIDLATAEPRPGARRSRGCRSARRSCAGRSPTTSASAPPALPDDAVREAAAAARARTRSSRRCRTATRRSSATRAPAVRRASAGGSRSRARSLRDAPLLILDEPTADLDAASGALVAAPSGGSARPDRAAHRPPTGLAARADRVVRLRAGGRAAAALARGMTATLRRLAALANAPRARLALAVGLGACRRLRRSG